MSSNLGQSMIFRCQEAHSSWAEVCNAGSSSFTFAKHSASRGATHFFDFQPLGLMQLVRGCSLQFRSIQARDFWFHYQSFWKIWK